MECDKDQLINSLENDKICIGSIDQQTIYKDMKFPLVLQSRDKSDKLCSIYLQEYIKKNRENILQICSKLGAILFDETDIQNSNEWAQVIYNLGLKETEYLAGAAVRTIVIGSKDRMENVQIWTTNESPSDQVIPFHHELAQTPFPPLHIMFYCQQPANQGGSTPIIRSDQVYDFIQHKYPDILDKFHKLGVRYIRTVPSQDDPSSAQGRSWKSMFNVQQKEQAEIAMTQQGFSYEWNDKDDCTITSQVLPAVKQLENGFKVFFNQVLAAYTGWVDSRNSYGKSVVFGDGSFIDQSFITDLQNYMNQNCCSYQWKQGSFIIIDNNLVYHSRQTFSGPRKVFAAVGNGLKNIPETKQTHLVLNSGDKMSQVGLGCWKIDNNICADVVYNAIKNGYRCIDEASDYGNEQECGQGIARAINEGIVQRKDLFITSKLWNTHHRKEHIKEAVMKSLQDLGLNYLDLYLIHFPIALKYVNINTKYPGGWLDINEGRMIEDEKVSYRETWEGMEGLVKEGLVRNIGCCNIGTAMLRDVLSYCQVKPAVLQVEIHPQNVQSNLVQFCRQKGIVVTGFSNLGASSYLQLNMAQKEEQIIINQYVTQLAIKYHKTPAQVILRWGIQQGIQIIPKSSNHFRNLENINLFDFELTNEELKAISKFNSNKRYNDPGVFCKGMGLFFPIYD